MQRVRVHALFHATGKLLVKLQLVDNDKVRNSSPSSTATTVRDTASGKPRSAPQPPQPFYGLFFRDHLGEPVPEQNFWTLWCKGRLTEADTQTIRLGTIPSGLTSAHLHHPPFFAGRMPFLPPNQQRQSIEGIRIREKTLEFNGVTCTVSVLSSQGLQ